MVVSDLDEFLDPWQHTSRCVEYQDVVVDDILKLLEIHFPSHSILPHIWQWVILGGTHQSRTCPASRRPERPWHSGTWCNASPPGKSPACEQRAHRKRTSEHPEGSSSSGGRTCRSWRRVRCGQARGRRVKYPWTALSASLLA